MTRAQVLDFGGVIPKTLFNTHDLSEAALGLPPGMPHVLFDVTHPAESYACGLSLLLQGS